jgi:hypothetical protein
MVKTATMSNAPLFHKAAKSARRASPCRAMP